MMLRAAVLLALVAACSAQTIITTGCNAASPPNAVRNMAIVPAKDAKSMRVSWQSPANTVSA